MWLTAHIPLFTCFLRFLICEFAICEALNRPNSRILDDPPVCPDCLSRYIGSSIRNLQIRIAEHRGKSYRTGSSLPSDWGWRGYNEQNALAGLMIGGGFRPLFASRYAVTRMGAAERRGRRGGPRDREAASSERPPPRAPGRDARPGCVPCGRRHPRRRRRSSRRARCRPGRSRTRPARTRRR